VRHDQIRRSGTLYEAFSDELGLLVELWARPPKLEPDDPPQPRRQLWRRGDPPVDDPEVREACGGMKVRFPEGEGFACRLDLTARQAATLRELAVEALARYDRIVQAAGGRVTLKTKRETATKVTDVSAIVARLTIDKVK
jgi:hypothetical protein